MVIYKCSICSKEFKQKYHLTCHLNRKYPCLQTIATDCKTIAKNRREKETYVQQSETPLLHNKNDIKKTLICKYCNKIFKYKSNLTVHIKSRCKVKQQIDGEKEDIFKRLVDEMQKIQQENQEIKEKLTQMEKRCVQNISKRKTITNCNNNTHNNVVKDSIVNNNTFMLVGCGNEDITKLDKEKIIRAVGAGFYSTHRLTDLVHFDPDHPEYHNVYISNMKDRTNNKICKNFIIWSNFE